MGSRLKGRVKKVEKPDWRIKKLVVYGVFILAVMIILWYLYLWEWNPDRDIPVKEDGETEESTSDSVPDDETSGATGGKKP
jgi:cytoskeletal protein RodZ